jgi:enoyl-CoA hydratase/carnithine racemase
MSNVHIRFRKQLLWIILDRPPLNLLTLEMLKHIYDAMHLVIKQKPHLLVFASTGEGDFCTGVELTGDSEEQQTELQRLGTEICAAFDELRTHSISSVALVKGNAFRTGSELVALCDTVIASENALFRLPAVNGKVFPCALSVSLPASIGHEATTRLMQSGETLKAKEAWRLGFVHQVLPPQRFVADADELLVMLASTHE